MKPTTLTRAYWISTVIFAIWLIGDGFGGVTQQQAGKDVLQHLGYPMYLLTIAGYAKFLAAIAILQSKYRTLKEWAFAGYAINCILAFASRAAVHDDMFMTLLPLLFLAIMFVPYYFWKKLPSA